MALFVNLDRTGSTSTLVPAMSVGLSVRHRRTPTQFVERTSIATTTASFAAASPSPTVVVVQSSMSVSPIHANSHFPQRRRRRRWRCRRQMVDKMVVVDRQCNIHHRVNNRLSIGMPRRALTALRRPIITTLLFYAWLCPANTDINCYCVKG